MLPWLLLIATLALIFGQRIAVALEGRYHGSRWVLVAQFVLGTYGGYFGGAASIMMLAVWCLFGETDIKSLHGPRTLLITAANTVAIIVFLFARAVLWPQTLAMLAGSLIGGFGGARLGRITPAHVARIVTLASPSRSPAPSSPRPTGLIKDSRTPFLTGPRDRPRSRYCHILWNIALQNWLTPDEWTAVFLSLRIAFVALAAACRLAFSSRMPWRAGTFPAKR